MRDINGARLGFKRAALDIIHQNGVRMSSLEPLRNEVSVLRRNVADISRRETPPLDELVLWQMNQQLGLLRRAGERRLPTVQELALQTHAQRQEIYQNTLSAGWVDTFQHSLETNFTRLAVSGADTSAAIDRLLSVGIADGRASAFRLSGAAAQTETGTSFWTAAILAASGLFRAVRQRTQTEYMKQAIAAIDNKTTDCCLRVHGQIQPLDRPFQLDGTPRFSDEVDSPPFHWNCRSAQSLYTPAMEGFGIPTEQMTSAAQAEMQAREEMGGTVPIHPAHSTSGR